MTDVLEASDAPITLTRAAELAGLSPSTLRVQANNYRRTSGAIGLQATRMGRDWVTTRRQLHEYLMGRDETNTHAAPLPPGYQAPSDRAPVEG